MCELAARLETSVHEAPLICGGAPAHLPFVFFDLETTGLSGGAGTQAFLVGSGRFEEDGGSRRDSTCSYATATKTRCCMRLRTICGVPEPS